MADVKKRALVLGAGNFGTCLAQHLARIGHQVSLWDIDDDLIAHINQFHQNPRYLTDIELETSIVGVDRLDSSLLDQVDFVVVVIPTQAVRSVLSRLGGKLPDHVTLVCACKGIEIESLKFPLDIVGEVLGEDAMNKTAVISGPSFAAEVAAGLPTAVTVAAKDVEAAQAVQKLFHASFFRAYTSNDPVGLEIAGALKNVVALASGACAGMGFQMNSRAALITRGLAELSRFGVALGANPLTFKGLGGIGDLLLTCTSEKSRNFTVGYELGKGKQLDDILKDLGSVAEGVYTTKAAHLLSRELGIDSPITEAVYGVLYGSKPLTQAVVELLSRDARSELEGSETP